MDPIEHQEVGKLKEDIDQRIQAAAFCPWSVRQATASQLLARANEAWWRVHRSDPSAYQRDLDHLNDLTGWRGQYAQVALWMPCGPRSSPVLMPPKFFGGNPLALHEYFVASMSLNHAILRPTSAPCAQELAEQQCEADAFTAHSSYFLRPYAYARFFRPRGEVLSAYANKIGVPAVASPTNWPTLNQRLSFYIETFPTRSVRFAPPPLKPTHAMLNSNVFVCAINSMVHDIVLRLLRPTRILLAGRASWQAWPDPGVAAYGQDVGVRVRGNGKCPVFHYRAASAVHGELTTIVRTNFLRTVSGPNSTVELRLLGSDVLAS